MDENALHSSSLRDAAGMLSRGSAEAEERELGGVQSLAGRNLPDGIRHGLDRNIQERLGESLDGGCGTTNLQREVGEFARNDPGVDACASVGAKHGGQGV